MQSPIFEILRLVAEGIVKPEEGQGLLEALREGYPREFDRWGRPSLDAVAAGSRPESRKRKKLGSGAGSSESEGPTDDPGPRPGVVKPPRGTPGPRARREDRSRPGKRAADPSVKVQPSPSPSPDTEAPIRSDANAEQESGERRADPGPLPGGLIEIPSGVLLRIETSAPVGGAVDPLTSVAVRGVPGSSLRVIRGSGVELSREQPTLWRLTWPSGMLFVELPTTQAGLEILGIPGSVGLSSYSGPFSCEGIRGGLTVHGASAPFRIRDVQGTVRLLRLAIRDGISTISGVNHDVEIETANDASVTIRASSHSTPHDTGGSPDTDPEVDADRGGRRGVWRVGGGAAQLNVGQVRGQIRLRPAGATDAGAP
jgi:hypothetical protein